MNRYCEITLKLSSLAILAVSPSVAQAQQATTVALPEIVVAPTPVPGGIGINANKIPALISSVSSRDFAERHSPSVTDAITSHVPAAVSINVDGSDLSPDLFYRGFDVSRISGATNGLAVYQNGVRINEAFGDGVNLDLIPPIAVDHADVFTNNPIFGLNELGGAIDFTMKNGFTFHGGDASILGGSYGRVNGFIEDGRQSHDWSVYVAADGYRDGGYRPFGAQNAERAYVDVGHRSLDSEVHGILGFGRSLLGVQGVTPQVLVNQRYNSVFTTPQTTNNQAGVAQLTARYDISPSWTVNSNVYVRQFDQYHIDGNDADVQNCGGNACLSDDSAPPDTSGRLRTFVLPNGNTIPFDRSVSYGTTALTSTHTTTVGTEQQATNRDRLFGHDNYFVVGASVDDSSTNFSSSTVLGRLNADFQNIQSGLPGAGAILSTRGQIGFSPVYVTSNATYVGAFALDTFNITKQLALTAGARFNYADVSLHDETGNSPALNSDNKYNRVNPVVGVAYEFTPALTAYVGYSEANRAPTPLENSCSDPARPCILETALVSDPPLRQVVSHTVEAGGRGVVALPNAFGHLTYKAGYFRTNNTNDIISVPSAISGQGVYTNVPGTLRQGGEVGLGWSRGPLNVYANYAHIDATYQFAGTLASPNNPFANAAGNIIVRPGDKIPGIPRNLGKLGFDYDVTDRLRVGMDAVLVGAQYYVGDDANQNPELPFYYTINARASYQMTNNVKIFALINNMTDNKYATYGTFYDPGTSATGVNATLASNANAVSPNANAVTVAQPLSVYGGIKVTF